MLPQENFGISGFLRANLVYSDLMSGVFVPLYMRYNNYSRHQVGRHWASADRFWARSNILRSTCVQCSLILNSPIRLQSAWSIFSIYATDRGVYSWPSVMQVHLSTCNYVQDVQCFYKHLVFIISTLNMKYKIHVFIISTSTYNTRFMFYKVQILQGHASLSCTPARAHAHERQLHAPLHRSWSG